MSSRRHMQVTGNEVHPRVCHAACTCVHANSLLDLNSQKWSTQFVRCHMQIVLDYMQTALDTGGGKESLYINIPYAPPPTSVQGLCKTLAKRRCVELPRGALKWVPCNLTKFCILLPDEFMHCLFHVCIQWIIPILYMIHCIPNLFLLHAHAYCNRTVGMEMKYV